VSQRPLVFVVGLTVGDLLLWNWSLNSNHDLLALVSGLTVPPLALASLWLIALSLGRLLAHLARQPVRNYRAGHTPVRSTAEREAQAAAQAGRAPSRKIAA
jgi:hypothetical protein